MKLFFEKKVANHFIQIYNTFTVKWLNCLRENGTDRKMEYNDLLEKLWTVGAEYIDIGAENIALPKYFGETALYYTERKLLVMIGETPDITITEMASAIHKTPSICSQIIKKFVNYGWVKQIRNTSNKRIYNLRLTEEGLKAYAVYAGYNKAEKDAIMTVLNQFDTKELEDYIKIQEAINEVCKHIIEGYK